MTREGVAPPLLLARVGRPRLRRARHRFGLPVGNDIASRLRYKVVGRDSMSGDVLLFDGQARTIRRLRVPVVAEDAIALGWR